MTITVTHATQATGTDAGNGEIRKAQWNEDHVVTGAADLGAANTWTVGGQIIDPGNASNIFTLDADSGNLRILRYASAGSPRWDLGVDLLAESGSSAGSNFFINRYNDAGTYLGQALSFNRATGLTTLEGLSVPTIELGSSVTDTTLSRLRAGQLGVEGKAIPYLFAQSGAAVSVGAVVTETVLATISFAGGELGPNGWIHVLTNWTLTNNANSKVCRVRVGGAAGTVMSGADALSSVFIFKPVYIYNTNSQSSQKAATGAGNLTGTGTGTSATATATVNTAAAWDLVISGHKANSADTITLESYSVFVCYGA